MDKMSGAEQFGNYYRAKMQKEKIIEKLKTNGCRITKQRLTLLDIILSGDCSSCKEIYYMASKVDSRIGTATVYRMVNLLEEIGAISRKNMYQISYADPYDEDVACVVELDDNSVKKLSGEAWNSVVREGMKACGYLKAQNVVSISIGKVT